MFCLPSNYGSIYTALGIAQALHKHGHKIAFLTGLASSKIIEKAGFKLVACTEKDNPAFRVYNWGKPFALLENSACTHESVLRA